MILERKNPACTDERGMITDIVENVPFDSLTLITSAKGAVRGNHYHRETTQYTYILEGRCRYYAQQPDQPVELTEVTKGDLVVSPPLERHAFEALEDSVLLAFCLGPRGGTQYESDTFRLSEPLVQPREKQTA